MVFLSRGVSSVWWSATERLLLIFKWIGNSIATFVNTLMIFVWLVIGNFILGSLLPEGLSAPLVNMTETLASIMWRWEELFAVIFLSRITYNAYQIYKHDWRYLGRREEE